LVDLSAELVEVVVLTDDISRENQTVLFIDNTLDAVTGMSSSKTIDPGTVRISGIQGCLLFLLSVW